MAQSRLELHAIFESILGSTHAYFQPPSSIRMTYPCIVYSRDAADEKRADNVLYAHKTRYLVTVIDPDPDSLIPGKVAKLPLCSYSRFFAADNLNHDVFNLFF